MGCMTRGIGNNDMGAVLKQVVKISNVFTRGATLFDFVVVYNSRKWRIDGKAGCRRRPISDEVLRHVSLPSVL